MKALAAIMWSASRDPPVISQSPPALEILLPPLSMPFDKADFSTFRYLFRSTGTVPKLRK